LPISLPDLGGVDHAELTLEIMAVLEERLGQKTRNLIRWMPFSELLDRAGGARLVLAQALTRIRQRGSAFQR